MALLFIDGFDSGGVATKWDNVVNAGIVTTTRFGVGRSLTIGNSSVMKGFTPATRVTVGCALHNKVSITFVGDSGGTSHLTLQLNDTSRRLELRRGGETGPVIATGTTLIPVDTWYYVEIQATVDDVAGVVEVRLNGVTTAEISFMGDTRNGGISTNIDAIQLAGTGSSRYADDLYVLDDTGTANVTFLGDVRIHTLTPNGNGASSQLLGSDADSIDNYLLVDELPHSTTDYVGSATVGAKDTYTLTDLPAGAATIRGVQVNMIAAKSDAGAASARTLLRISGTDYPGTTRGLSASYLTYRDLYDINPATSSAWTATAVNAMEAGVEVM